MQCRPISMRFLPSKILLVSYLALGGHAEDDEEKICETQTEALDDNENITAAFDALANATDDVIIERETAVSILQDNDVVGDVIEGCVLVDNNETISCKFNYSAYTDGVKSACEDAGGVFYEGAAKIICTTTKRRAELRYLNDPLCVGVNCSDPEEVFKEKIGDLEEELSEASGANCLAVFDNVDEDLPSAGFGLMASIPTLLFVSLAGMLSLV